MKKRVLLKAPILTQSGYGEHSRFVYRALKDKEDIFDLYIEPLNWGQTGWIWEDSEERRDIDQCIGKFYQIVQQNVQNAFDVCIHVDLPTAWKRVAPMMIGVTAGIECDAVSPTWLQPTFGEVDKIIVPSDFSKEGFLNSMDKYKDVFDPNTQSQLPNLKEQLKNKISVVHYPVRDYQKVDLDLNFETDFNFLMVSQWGPRKNITETIRMFYREFFNNSDVGLVIKTNIARNAIPDRFHVTKRLEQVKEEFNGAMCKVYLLHGEMTHDEIHSLYTHPKIKAMINFGHGEGYGLPLFEAAYCGLPVIAHDFGGQKDFLYAPKKDKKGVEKKRAHFSKVLYKQAPVQSDAVWNGVIEPDAEWAFVDMRSAATAMKETIKDYGLVLSEAKRLKENIVNIFDQNKKYKAIRNIVLGIVEIKPEDFDGVSFCIPTNGKRIEKTKMLLNSIRKQTGRPFEIILCGDVDSFKDEKDVILLDRKEEAHSRKVALLRNKAAEKSKYEVIAWCDDDIILEKDWLEKTIQHTKNTGWNILGNKIYSPDGTRYWDRATLTPHKLVDYSEGESNNNLYQTSTFFLVRRKVWDLVKWDESKLVYADREGQMPEDVKYSLDLRSKNYPFHFNEKCLVWHNDESYTEWSFQTLKKEVIEKSFNIAYFPDNCEEFLQANK